MPISKSRCGCVKTVANRRDTFHKLRFCKNLWQTKVGRRGRMVSPAPDSHSIVAKAYGWAARIMTVALEMVVPGVLGIWIDRQLGTVALFTVIGFGLGLSLGMWHLLRMTARKDVSSNIASPKRK